MLLSVDSPPPLGSRYKVALSEARKTELLSKTVSWVSEVATLFTTGVEAEGREVVTVSLTPVREAAKTFTVLLCQKQKTRMKTNSKNASFFAIIYLDIIFILLSMIYVDFFSHTKDN